MIPGAGWVDPLFGLVVEGGLWDNDENVYLIQ